MSAATVKYLILYLCSSHGKLQVFDFKKPPNSELSGYCEWIKSCFCITLIWSSQTLWMRKGRPPFLLCSWGGRGRRFTPGGVAGSEPAWDSVPSLFHPLFHTTRHTLCPECVTAVLAVVCGCASPHRVPSLPPGFMFNHKQTWNILQSSGAWMWKCGALPLCK